MYRHSNQLTAQEEILIKLLKFANTWFKGDLEAQVRSEFLKHLKRFQKVRSVELHNTFLELVYNVYEDPKTQAVERRELRGSIFIGLSSRSASLRQKFTEIVDKEVSRNLQHRVCQVILKPDTWNSIGNIYWIPQGLDLIFGMAWLFFMSHPSSAFYGSSTSETLSNIGQSARCR